MTTVRVLGAGFECFPALHIFAAMTNPTYSLVLTVGQAEQLNRVMSIGELAIAEHYRTGWLPSGQGDAALMQRYLQAMTSAPSLELPFSALREWLRQQEKRGS